MGMGRAQHDGVRQPLKGKIVEIAALAGQEALILAPLGRIADPGAGRHGASLLPAFRCRSRRSRDDPHYSSWPGSSRPSTSRRKHVDPRDKLRDDDWG